jgi:hypothetical protein
MEKLRRHEDDKSKNEDKNKLNKLIFVTDLKDPTIHLPLKRLLALPNYLAQFRQFENVFSPNILISKKIILIYKNCYAIIHKILPFI